jgi:hypothetical protein
MAFHVDLPVPLENGLVIGRHMTRRRYEALVVPGGGVLHAFVADRPRFAPMKRDRLLVLLLYEAALHLLSHSIARVLEKEKVGVLSMALSSASPNSQGRTSSYSQVQSDSDTRLLSSCQNGAKHSPCETPACISVWEKRRVLTEATTCPSHSVTFSHSRKPSNTGLTHEETRSVLELSERTNPMQMPTQMWV